MRVEKIDFVNQNSNQQLASNLDKNLSFRAVLKTKRATNLPKDLKKEIARLEQLRDGSLLSRIFKFKTVGSINREIRYLEDVQQTRRGVF